MKKTSPLSSRLLTCALPVGALPLFWALFHQLWEGTILTSALSLVLAPLSIAFFLLPARGSAQSTRDRWWARQLISAGLIIGAFGFSLCIYAYPGAAANPRLLNEGVHLVGLIVVGVGLVAVWTGRHSLARAQPLATLTPAAGLMLLALPWEPLLRRGDLIFQRLGADFAFSLLSLAAYPVKYWNNFTFYSDRFYLIINETCSGVNLLLTVSAYVLVYGQLFRLTLSSQWRLLFWSWPLAFLFNGLRIAVIFLLGHHGGQALAMGPWHTWSAYLLLFPLFYLLHKLAEQLEQGSPRSA